MPPINAAPTSAMPPASKQQAWPPTKAKPAAGKKGNPFAKLGKKPKGKAKPFPPHK